MWWSKFRPVEVERVDSTSRIASTSGKLGALAAAAFIIGPTGAHLGLIPGLIGFGIFVSGLLLGLLGLLTGLIGLWHTRPGADRSGRFRAMTGVGVGLLLAVIVCVPLGSMKNIPTINDITTNPDDPPSFGDVRRMMIDHDFRYPGEAFASQQRHAYPDLKPIELEQSREISYRGAETAAIELGWRITNRNIDQGILEATDSTPIFRFVDDIVIRVRSQGDHSVIDLRSRSRTGQGDLGANAARIRAFREKLRN